MKKVVYLLGLLFLFNSCASGENPKPINCDQTAKFGDTDICLPKIGGYNECYDHPIVKALADATEIDGNLILGYYLDDSTFQRVDSLGAFRFDNHFKVYTSKQLKNYRAGQQELAELKKVISQNFISKAWESNKEALEEIQGDIQLGVPSILETYALDKQSFTYVLAMRYELYGQRYTGLITISGFLTRQRLIFMAYYLDYNGEESIKIIKKQSNKILLNFLET